MLQVTAPGKATWRAAASSHWAVHCQAVGVPFSDEQPAMRSAVGTVAPARLTTRTGIHPSSAHLDLCSGYLSVAGEDRAIAPRTFSARGAVLLDVDQGANAALGAASQVAAAFPTMGVVPPPGSVPGTVPLATPISPPPAAPKLGYWSDGVGHVQFSTRTKAGRIVTAGFDAPDALSTNVVGYLGGQLSKTVPLVPVQQMSAGVTAVQASGQVTLALPPPLLASLAGSQLDPLCLRFLSTGRAEGSGGPLRPSSTLVLPFSMGKETPDACLVRKAVNHRIVARVPLTDAGRRYEELEQGRSTTIGALLDASLLGTRLGVGLAPPEALAANGPVVALAAIGDPPPPDAVGYWTDGVGHAYAATLDSNGRILWAERDGGTLRSNVLFGGSP